MTTRMNSDAYLEQVSLIHACGLPDHSVSNHAMHRGRRFSTLPLSATAFRLRSRLRSRRRTFRQDTHFQMDVKGQLFTPAWRVACFAYSDCSLLVKIKSKSEFGGGPLQCHRLGIQI